jgi:hypothetical protein
MLKIFVGDVGQYLSDLARFHDKSAYQIDSYNLYNTHNGTVYVSIGDLNNLKEFNYILAQATELIYAPPDIWPTAYQDMEKFSIAWVTVSHLATIAAEYSIPVKNLPVIDNLSITTIIDRTTNSPQLWVAGCSTSLGVAVQHSERYANIVSSNLGLDLNMLAQSGSSIAWSAGQILKSNINSGDIVIWGLTTVDRFQWYSRGHLEHIGANYYQLNPNFNKVIKLELLDHEHRLYESLDSIYQVQNFCNKINARLILVGIHANIELSTRLVQKDNFVMIQGLSGLDWNSEFLDYGTDNLHPGPTTHKFYAEKILNKIKNLNSSLTSLTNFKGI